MKPFHCTIYPSLLRAGGGFIRGPQVVIEAYDPSTEIKISSDNHVNGSYYVKVKITPKQQETELC